MAHRQPLRSLGPGPTSSSHALLACSIAWLLGMAACTQGSQEETPAQCFVELEARASLGQKLGMRVELVVF